MTSLAPLLADRRVILCVGCGGVGKTTVAASIGLAAAQRGKNVLCLTIDPARRLASSLGLAAMTTEETRVAPELFERAGVAVSGSLTVMMLDTKRTFDDLVRRYASSDAARDRILDNRLYQYASTSLAGTQEYMAMEKLLSVEQDPRFDLIVLDTPPTSNALDFLDAPARMMGALDSAAMRWFIQAFQGTGKFSLNLVAKSVALVLKGIGKLTGGGFLEQLAEFVTELDDLFGGFRQRATRVAEALRGPRFGYVLVTSPDPAALREVGFFADRLHEQGMRADALVVNRVHRVPRRAASAADVARRLAHHGLSLDDGAAARVAQALEDERTLGELDAAHLATLGAPLADAPRVGVPALPSDVHDLATLAGVAALLCP